MAALTGGASNIFGVDMDLVQSLGGPILVASSSIFRVAPNRNITSYNEFTSATGDFVYDSSGRLVGGTITGWTNVRGGVETFTVAEISFPVASLVGQLDASFYATLFAGSDHVSGTPGSDDLRGYAGDDTLLGLAGSDHLDGGAGVDVMIGGSGGDSYVVDDSADEVVELAGEGYDFVDSSASFVLPDNIEVLQLIGADAVNGTGNDQDNSIWGNTANNKLAGGGGDDTLVVGGGNDTFDGGSGLDVLDLHWVLDKLELTLVQSPGSAVLDLTAVGLGVTAYHNIEGIIGTWGDDLLVGSTKNDSLDGYVGDDTLRGGSGNDTLDGYFGADFIDLSDATSGVKLALLDAGAEGTADLTASGLGVDTYRNFEGVIGSAFNDTLTGGSGFDTLDGGGGTDSMAGGDGSDTYVMDGVGDVVSEVANQGTADTVMTAFNYTLGANLENLTLIGSGAFNGTGNEFGNWLKGNSADNTLSGLAGGDTLTGGGGDDILVGGGGVDLFFGGTGDDTYYVDESGDQEAEATGEGYDTVYSSVDHILNGEIERLILTGSAPIYGTGTVLDNSIFGNGAANVLYGYDGNDTVHGGGGSDYVVGGLGEDELNGDDGEDQLAIDVGNDTLDGGAGIDQIALGGANTGIAFTLVQGSSDTVLDLTAYGCGVDVYRNVEGAFGTQYSDTLSGSESGDRFDGFYDSDSLVGGGGDDTLDGNDGSDTLEGGTGIDNLIGGSGDDRYFIDDIADAVVEKATVSGIDEVISSTALTAAFASVEHYAFTGDVGINFIGNALDNRISATFAADTVNGADGFDTLLGGGGADSLNGGEGNDLIEGGIDDDTLAGGVNNDSLDAGSGSDSLVGGDGDDRLDGGSGSDTLDGGAGNDIYFLGNSAEKVVDSAGFDGVVVGFSIDLAAVGIAGIERVFLDEVGHLDAAGNSVANEIVGNSFDNRLTGLVGNDSLDGWIGDDSLDGGAGNDLLFGFDGDDTLMGGAGNDAMTGEQGNDVMSGGAGADIYGYNPFADGADVVHTGDNGIDRVVFFGGLWDWDFDRIGNDLLITALTDSSDVYDESQTLRIVGQYSGTGIAYFDADFGFSANLFYGGNPNFTRVYTPGTMSGKNQGANAELIAGSDGDDKIYGNGGQSDWLFGGDGNDSIVGGSTAIGMAWLYGNAGNDTLGGGAGDNHLEGGAGDDRYIVDSAGDVVEELGSDAHDELWTNQSLTAAVANIEHYKFTGAMPVSFTTDGAANRVVGTAKNDTLSGMGGDDTLDGGAGADVFKGGTGADLYIVDNAKDVVDESGGDGNDKVRSVVSFVLAAGLESLELLGSAALAGTGNADANTLTGNNGANKLDGKGGADTMGGAGGNDTYVVDDAGDHVIETVTGSAGGIDLVLSAVSFDLLLADRQQVENVTLTGSADIDAEGNALANVLTGNSGDNILDGRGGADRLVGGLGDDTYVVDLKTDVVTEAAKAGIDTVESAFSYVLGANLENLVLLPGFGNIDGAGNSLDNELTGNEGNNRLDGKAGADQMAGGLGDDTYVIDNVGDVVDETGGDGIDTIITPFATALDPNFENLSLTGAAGVSGIGNALDNVILGNTGANLLDGQGGADSLAGDSGNDMLVGGAGDDRLDGGIGVDALAGGDGDDTYVVDNAKDVVTEQANGGIDTVRSGIAYALGAEVENLTLAGAGAIGGTGNALANIIVGNTGANSLAGGDGADTLDGGAGNDTLTGGAGDDLLNLASGNDTVRYTGTLDGHDILDSFDGNATGGQDQLNLDALFDGMGVAAGARAGRVLVDDQGSTVDVAVDLDGNIINGYELTVATLMTSDAIAIGQDVVVGT